MAALSLSPQVFAILSALIEERCGIHYSLGDRELLADKISPRAIEAGFDSMLDYYYFLRYDAGGAREVQALIETLTVHETYFFREFPAIEMLVRDVLVPRVRAGGRPRIWCAAASTGEEPLTLAMALDHAGVLGKVDVIASDISAKALGRAQEGVYPRRSVRNVPPAAEPLAAKYLSGGGDGQYAVAKHLRGAVQWILLNLVDRAAVAAVGQFDVILCRNVFIYFRDDTARTVVDRLGHALRPDGMLVVGVSESLLRFGTALACEEHAGIFVYRKAR